MDLGWILASSSTRAESGVHVHEPPAVSPTIVALCPPRDGSTVRSGAWRQWYLPPIGGLLQQTRLR